MTANKTVKTTSDTVYGKVESYEPGKSIKVTYRVRSFPPNRSTWSKDAMVNVASDVKTGGWVSVVEKTAPERVPDLL